MRVPHFLTKPVRDTQPDFCIWYDTETNEHLDKDGRKVQTLWFGWACYSRQHSRGKWTAPEWFRFETIPEFWEWLESKVPAASTLYLFAHNGAFDLPVMSAFTEVPKRGWQLKKAVCDAPPIILTWKRDKQILKFIDTLNIWRMPLDKIGKGYGIPKLKMPDKSASTEAWDAYGKRDCEVIRVAVTAWLAFLDKHNLGPFAPTLASQALKSFKFRFMDHEIFIDNNHKALSMARESFCGGRTECFRLGKFNGPLWYLDVVSMYPAVMLDNDFPVKLKGVYRSPDSEEVARWSSEYCMVADVDIDTDTPDYPIIKDKRLVFPVGAFRITLAHPELMHAYYKGRITKWHSVTLYEKAPIFRKFVETLFPLRIAAGEAGNEAEYFNLRIFLNALYGKWGQNGRRFEECGQTDPNAVWTHLEIDADTDTAIRYRAFGGVVQAWIDEDESTESHPAIAACITSYARLVLLAGIERAGRQNVLYCDTDSIYVNEAGFKRMEAVISEKTLGAWSIKNKFSLLELRGPKDYTADGEDTIKGIRATAVKLALNTYRQDKFIGFRGLLREGDLTAPKVTTVKKTLKRVYKKGTRQVDGSVRPFRLRSPGKRRSRQG